MSSIFKTILCFFATLFLSAIYADAQSYEEFRRHAQDSFSSTRDSSENTYISWREKANSEYSNLLRSSWERMKGTAPVEVPKEDPLPPVVKQENDPVPAPVIIDVPEPSPSPSPEPEPNPAPDPVPTPLPSPSPVEPISPQPQPYEHYLPLIFDFYGAEVSINFPQSGVRKLSSPSEEEVSRLWDLLSESRFDRTVSDCLQWRKSLNLPDWTFVQMVRAFCETVRPTRNDAVVLQLYILSQCGLDVVHARDDSGNLHMLLNTDCTIYNYSSWNVNGSDMYLIEKSDVSSLYISDARFPGGKPARMAITSSPTLPLRLSEERIMQSARWPQMKFSVCVNRNLIDLLNDYPSFTGRSDQYERWAYVANKPMDETVKRCLYDGIRQAISGKSDEEAVGMILNFVQTSLTYGYDNQIWGDDRAFYAEETIFYPYCDCEDHAILFARLVRDLTGLDVALVYYPGHMASAVRFRSHVDGDAFRMADSSVWVVCDPTYTNASIGESMTGVDSSQAVLIPLK